MSGKGHGHTHGLVDPSISTNERGLWATKWSFVALFITAGFQLVVALLSNSVALLADTIHNLGDAATAIPLGIAFMFGKRPATRRYTYGFGKVEDLAGLAIVLTILISAGIACYQAIDRLLHPQPVTYLGAIIAASIVGFIGNELVAVFRIRVGREIGSAALIADGHHARTDGWTSLAVLFGAVGVYFGYPKADPLIGLLITVAILVIVWQSAKSIFSRMLDGVDAGVIDGIEHAASHVAGVVRTTDVRARWIGHRMRAEVSVAVDPTLSVAEGHDIARRVEAELRENLEFLSAAVVHVDPATEAGEEFHHAMNNKLVHPRPEVSHTHARE
ncbi:MAG: cation transporter [Gemmatimonadaceae bacterium]|nr:cation transporter [Gemmatimonadaceae bacterium]